MTSNIGVCRYLLTLGNIRRVHPNCCSSTLKLGLALGPRKQCQASVSSTRHVAQDSAVSTVSSQTELQQKPLPLMTSRKLEYLPLHTKPKQAWLETLDVTENKKLGIVDLHPDIFGVAPRLDILWWNVYWQRKYKFVDYTFRRRRSEMPGTNKKPWPQKGLGKARHGSKKSPLFYSGGKAHGPRGPRSYFFMLPYFVRTLGLRVALSVKYAQDHLHIVDSLNMPSDDHEYITDLIESRGWGLSVLFVDDTDIMPRNIAMATDSIMQYNLMPVYGLNVHSILKHETLVLTLDAVNKIEEKLLLSMHTKNTENAKFERVHTY